MAIANAEDVRIVFRGAFYEVVEDDVAEVVLLEGKPVSSACKYHGNHGLFDLSCPHVESLLKKIGYFL